MRSWTLFFSAIFASVMAVSSLVIPFCLFLNFYHGDLFVAASDRTAQRGIEVMLYLTPILMLFGTVCFYLILRCLSQPQKIFELKQWFKLILKLGTLLFFLIFFFQFLDGRMGEIQESLGFGIISLIVLSVPLLIGLISANTMYLKCILPMYSSNQRTAKVAKYKLIQTPPL